jgi:hypothetical protein
MVMSPVLRDYRMLVGSTSSAAASQMRPLSSEASGASQIAKIADVDLDIFQVRGVALDAIPYRLDKETRRSLIGIPVDVDEVMETRRSCASAGARLVTEDLLTRGRCALTRAIR